MFGNSLFSMQLYGSGLNRSLVGSAFVPPLFAEISRTNFNSISRKIYFNSNIDRYSLDSLINKIVFNTDIERISFKGGL